MYAAGLWAQALAWLPLPPPPELQDRALTLSLRKSQSGQPSERGVRQGWKQAVLLRLISAGKPGLRQEGGKIIKGLNPE